MQKKIMLAIFVLAVLSFFYFDLHQLLTLDAIKGKLGEFHELRDQSPLKVFAGFFLIYVVVTALSLPGAAILTLLGGALFGLGWGFILVSFASSIGASCAFLICLLYTSPSPRDQRGSRMPSSA